MNHRSSIREPEEAPIKNKFVISVDPRRQLPPAEFPVPVSTPSILRTEGACVEPSVDPEWFDIDDSKQDPTGAAAARGVCAQCPLQQRCLDYALDSEPYGIWGGLDAAERLALRGSPIADVTARHEAEKLREMMRRGVVASQIAEKYGVTVRTVERWRSQAGFAVPREEAA